MIIGVMLVRILFNIQPSAIFKYKLVV